LRGVDVVFPLLHGPYGEDGTVQGLLELAGIPYVGAGVSASAVGMDKALMKALFHEQGLPIPEFCVVRRGEWEKDRASRLAFIAAVLGAPPFFVKPSNSGSSIGISRVSTPEALVQAIDQACLYDRKVLVERAIDAREVECSVLGNEDPIASVVGEIVPKGPFYDYASKYTEGGMSLVVPAVLPPELLEQTRELALRAYRAIDCAGMARVDFFVRRTDLALLVNEINTIPGFTAMSVFPKLWEASGLPYPRLVDRLIELALERAADRARSHPTA
ncbi:MAG: D-alanine--D-alanine ligase, partial [Deltaproteobacteria bacterium]|nr:D-alanine--D-alanine ligase [Deltaproteobacteria bacterium]